MHIKHLAIMGVGLIGGSVALAARRAGVAERISGWDTSSEVLSAARERGVIDGVEESFHAGRASDADLVYLAAPVGAILSFLRTSGNLLKPGAIVTDAGSTKREICRAARAALPREVAFVGGHPMAGSERAGVEFADADLFRGAAYAMIVDESANSDSARVVGELVSSIGAIPVKLTAEQHDRIVARISHTPQMLSTALALAVARTRGAETLALAGSGLVEMTRLAESSWSVWEDICRTNADEIAAALDETIAEIEAVRVAVLSGDSSGLSDMFGAAGKLIDRLHDQRNEKGLINRG
jgi:prephenate dehydrogenase